jgi:hypothetical protein
MVAGLQERVLGIPAGVRHVDGALLRDNVRCPNARSDDHPDLRVTIPVRVYYIFYNHIWLHLPRPGIPARDEEDRGSKEIIIHEGGCFSIQGKRQHREKHPGDQKWDRQSLRVKCKGDGHAGVCAMRLSPHRD